MRLEVMDAWWWLPDNPSHRVQGMLLQAAQGYELRIHGPLGKMPPIESGSTIQGVNRSYSRHYTLTVEHVDSYQYNRDRNLESWIVAAKNVRRQDDTSTRAIASTHRVLDWELGAAVAASIAGIVGILAQSVEVATMLFGAMLMLYAFYRLTVFLFDEAFLSRASDDLVDYAAPSEEMEREAAEELARLQSLREEAPVADEEAESDRPKFVKQETDKHVSTILKAGIDNGRASNGESIIFEVERARKALQRLVSESASEISTELLRRIFELEFSIVYYESHETDYDEVPYTYKKRTTELNPGRLKAIVFEELSQRGAWSKAWHENTTD